MNVIPKIQLKSQRLFYFIPKRGSPADEIVFWLLFRDNQGCPFLFLTFEYMVSDELIEELREIIRTEYGKEVSFKEAWEIGNGLVGFFDTLAQIDFRIKQREKYADK